MQPATEHKRIKELIEKDLPLPSLPAIAVNILKAVRDNQATLTALGEIITADPALTARMLKIANSDMFSRNGSIHSVARAMVVLGTDMIKNIALSFVIATDTRHQRHVDLDLDLFWKQSVTTAVAAELLSRQIQCRDDDIFVTGLLKNIGKLILAQAKGETYSCLLDNPFIDGNTLRRNEIDIFGFDHFQVGYTLLKDWNLPDTICEPILHQTQPDAAPGACRTPAMIIALAEKIAYLCLDQDHIPEAPQLQQKLQEHFGLEASRCHSLFDTVAHNSNEIFELFDLEQQDIIPYTALLQQANAELARMNLSKEQVLLELNVARMKAERMAAQLKESNDRLNELVYRDGLTGLYNHRYFHEALNNEFLRARRHGCSLSLIIFDIDHFKQVNDSYGHPAGDMVLINLAKAVNTAIRPSDIVARYGGEEFAVILPETGLAGARVFAARLRRCIEGIATNVNGQAIYITISAGISSTTAESAEVTKNQLLEAADRALYRSKNNGRNQISTFSPG